MGKFATQHKDFSYGGGQTKQKARAHRDGNITWITSGKDNTASNKITHPTVASAKKFMNHPFV